MNILRCKVALIGDPRVGKTSIVTQLTRQYFNHTYQTTLGTDYSTYEVKIKDSNYTIQLHIMDLTGFSIFRDTIYSQVKDANFILYVYDSTNLESFQSVKLWKETMKDYIQNKNCVEFLVGNKTDLRNKIAVDSTSITNLAKLYNLNPWNVSAVRIICLILVNSREYQ